LVREVFRDPHLSPPTQRSGHVLYAYVAVQERDFARALSEAEMAASLAPYDASLLGQLSDVLIMCGRPAQAIEWSLKAATNDPAMEWKYQGTKGWALELLGKYEESLAALKLSRTHNAERNPFIPLLMVIDLVNLNRPDEVKAMLVEALKLDTKFTQATWRDTVFNKDMSIIDREIADLAKAGLPEK
jgi:tetratricopeptide (TPR) repeat protein